MLKIKHATTAKKPIPGKVALLKSPIHSASKASTAMTNPNHPKMVIHKRAMIYNI
jgi:hypothetical protein